MKETNFKQTDIGLIPEDWTVKCVKEVADNFTGLTYSPNDVKKYGTIVLRSSNIQNGKLCFENNVFVEMDIPNRAKTKNGDILICVRNGSSELIGKSALIPAEYENVAFGAFMTVLRSVQVNNLFLLYIWQTSNTQRQIHETFGATINQITDKDFSRILIPLPPTIEEQERIANALIQVDDLLAALDEQIEKKKLIKQGTMQQLLTGKTRLKGFTGEWKTVKLGEIGNTFNGLSGKSAVDFGTGNAKYVTFLNVLNNPIIDTSILENVNINLGEKQNAVHKGDLFFNTSSETPEEVGVCAVILEEIKNLYLNSFCFGFRLFDENVDGKYLAFYFRSKTGRDLMTTLAQGATRYNLSKSAFDKSEITIPSTLAEQQAIASILSIMDEEIQALQEERDKYALVKQGMMQQLLTGKIRLN